MADSADGDSSPEFVGISSPMTNLAFSFENASLTKFCMTPKRLSLPSDSESDLNESVSSPDCFDSGVKAVALERKISLGCRPVLKQRNQDLRRACLKYSSSSPMLFDRTVEKENIRSFPKISYGEGTRKGDDKADVTKFVKRNALGIRDLNRENNCNRQELASLLKNDDFSGEDLCVEPLDSCPPECTCENVIAKKFKPSGFAPRSKTDCTSRSSSLPKSEGYHSASSDFSEEDGFLEPLQLEHLDDDDVSSKFSSLIHGPIIKSDNSPRKSGEATPSFRRCSSMNEFETPVQRNIFSRRVPFLTCDENLPGRSTEVCGKRLEPPHDSISPIHSKRWKPCLEGVRLRNDLCKRSNSSPNAGPSTPRPFLHRSYSETEATIMRALQKSSSEPDLIGDCSKPFCLPLISGKHQDLRAISSETVAKLINNEYVDTINSYTIIDCRYPYEYEGGHIKGAINIYAKDDLLKRFLPERKPFKMIADSDSNKENCAKRDVLLFHCEFSSERGPNLSRFLRKKDREYNRDNYPALHYPEIYLLEGGYKAFFSQWQSLCEPMEYRPMCHPNHENELRHFRAKSRSWNGENQLRLLAKPGVKRQM